MAHATLGQPNVNDESLEYRIGILPHDHPGMVTWKEPGWVPAREFDRETSVFARREDKVVVERRRINEEEIERIKVWDIAADWPMEAVGPTLSTTSWYF